MQRSHGKEQLEMIRSLVETARTEATLRGDGRPPDAPPEKVVLTEFTDSGDIETTFERLMTVYGVGEDRWAIK